MSASRARVLAVTAKPRAQTQTELQTQAQKMIGGWWRKAPVSRTLVLALALVVALVVVLSLSLARSIVSSPLIS